MKKAVCLLLAVILSMACLSGCGQSSGNAKDPNESNSSVNVKDSNGSNSSVNTPSQDGNQIDFFDSFYGLGVTGYNGEGRIWDLGYSSDYIEYDKENSDITKFLKSVKLILKQNGTEVDRREECWSNGDTLTITLSYSKSTADELGISFKETSKDFTIFGLLEANNSPAEESEINVEALADKLQTQLTKGDKIDSAYFCYFSNNAITKDLGESADGKLHFPSGYEYCSELFDNEGGIRYIYSVNFVVSGDSGYYLCETGVNPDGTQCGEFFISHRYYETEDVVLEKLTDRWGKNNIIRADGV